MSEVTRILERIERGEEQAAEQLLLLVYQELRRLAAVLMAREQPGHTLQPTALVHEAWLRLVAQPMQGRSGAEAATGSNRQEPQTDAPHAAGIRGKQSPAASSRSTEAGSLGPAHVDSGPTFANRRHFFAAAAQAMRRILVENARRKRRLKHGGARQRVDLQQTEVIGRQNLPVIDLLALDEALKRLAQQDPLKARLVELRFFVGLSVKEAAEVLDISLITAKRHWRYTRAWLHRELS